MKRNLGQAALFTLNINTVPTITIPLNYLFIMMSNMLITLLIFYRYRTFMIHIRHN